MTRTHRCPRLLPRLATLAALTTVVGLGRLARADAHGDLLNDAGAQLGKYYALVRQLTSTPASPEVLPSADQCDADVAAWKKRGVKDADRIFSYDFNAHPKAKNNTIAMADMPAVCAAYRPLYAAYKLGHDLTGYDETLLKVRDKLVVPGDSVLTAPVIDGYARSGDPAACRAAVAAAKQADPTMLAQGATKTYTIAEFETKVCDGLAAVMPTFLADARAALAKATEAAKAPYVAAGIGGKKLELLVQYQGVYWRLPGGTRTDDPKRLAAAATLFQWLEAPDPADAGYTIHTIRKYRFKGDDLLGVSEKQYRKRTGVDLGTKVFK